MQQDLSNKRKDFEDKLLFSGETDEIVTELDKISYPAGFYHSRCYQTGLWQMHVFIQQKIKNDSSYDDKHFEIISPLVYHRFNTSLNHNADASLCFPAVQVIEIVLSGLSPSQRLSLLVWF
jgi:hypothetical protein